MGDSFQYGDIIFLGLVAVFIALRLRAMLGRNDGTDTREVWKQASRDLPAEKPVTIIDRNVKKPVPPEEVVPVSLQDNKAVAEGLRAIRAADAQFSTTEFLAGSKLAFEWIIDAFTRGNKDKLRSLLAPEPLEHFIADIDARATSATTHEATLVSIVAADVTEASLKSSKAQITVQFTTEQVHVTRDKDKNIVEGDLSAIEKVVDVWTFERDISSRDPNWKIVAT